MRVYNGETGFDIQKSEDRLYVLLDSSQMLEDSLVTIKNYAIVRENIPDGYQKEQLIYTLPEGVEPFQAALSKAKTRVEKLRFAERLSTIEGIQGGFRIPYLHPENLYVRGERVLAIHYGLSNLVAPMNFDATLILQQYRALVLKIFHQKFSFEDLISGIRSFTDKFSQKIQACKQLSDLCLLIDQELDQAVKEEKRTKSLVSKVGTRALKIWSVVAFLALVTLSWAFYHSNQQNQITFQKQAKLINAQSDFLKGSDVNAQQNISDLSKLSKPIRYHLAVQAIGTLKPAVDLTSNQRLVYISALTLNSEDDLLNFWIYYGRGNYSAALNLAEVLNDQPLMLYSNESLLTATAADLTMKDGSKKQQLLKTYSTAIQDLKKQLGMTK